MNRKGACLRLFSMVVASLWIVLPLAAGHHDEDPKIRRGSKVYVDSNNGFEIFIEAAFRAKHVDLHLVSSPDAADYVLDSSLFHDKEFAATTKAAGTYRISEAAFKLTAKSGDIVWAYAVTKGILSRGKQSVAEACAKHIRELVEH